MFEPPNIPGASDVTSWFGYWPTFHDAEVLSIHLDRLCGCEVVIHAFHMTSEVDAVGRYVFTKHALVTFRLAGFPQDEAGIVNTRIEGFNQQNVLSSASVQDRSGSYELRLEGIYGADCSIVCNKISVTLEPGIPTGSVYQSSHP